MTISMMIFFNWHAHFIKNTFLSIYIHLKSMPYGYFFPSPCKILSACRQKISAQEKPEENPLQELSSGFSSSINQAISGSSAPLSPTLSQAWGQKRPRNAGGRFRHQTYEAGYRTFPRRSWSSQHQDEPQKESSCRHGVL